MAGQHGRHDYRISSRYGGLFVPLITPFTAAGDLDALALESLAHRMLDAGATGIVALGTTAEAPTLTMREARRGAGHLRPRLPRPRSAADRRRGHERHPPLAGRPRRLAGWPEIRAALVVVPYYNRPGEDGVLAHFRALAARTPVPLVVYNIPLPHRPAVRLAGHAAARGADPGGRRQARSRQRRPGHRRDDGRACRTASACWPGTAVRARAPGARRQRRDQRLGARVHGQLRRAVGAWRAGDVPTARPLGHRLAIARGQAVRRAEPGSDQGGPGRAWPYPQCHGPAAAGCGQAGLGRGGAHRDGRGRDGGAAPRSSPRPPAAACTSGADCRSDPTKRKGGGGS